MKAIRFHQFGDPSVLRYEEAPDPSPGPGQVLIAVKAIGVNPVDTYIRSGIYGPREFPVVLGTDAAGVVEAVGPDVTRPIAVGDRVYTARTLTGAYAERVLCDQVQVRPLPARVSFEQGAALFVPYATAYRALFQRAHAKPGEWVLVHGASGGVGIAAVQLARAAGLRVIGTSSTEKGRQLIGAEGAEFALDHTSPGYLDAIRGLTGHPTGGVHVVLEMLANVNLDKSLGLLAMGGRIVVIGNRGTVEINPRQAMSRESSILGLALFNASPDALHEACSAIEAGLSAGTLRPVVGHSLPLSEAARAHELILKPGSFGKIVLIP